jgi:hypothetical protein
MSIHTHIHTYKYIYIHKYTHTHIHTHINTTIHTYMYTHINIYIHKHIYIYHLEERVPRLRKPVPIVVIEAAIGGSEDVCCGGYRGIGDGVRSRDVR